MLRTTLAIALGLVSLNSFAAFEAISDSGATVLRNCQGLPPVDNGVCEVPTNPIPDLTLNGANNGSAFPGQAGTWAAVAGRDVAVIANGTTIGTLRDRVWKRVGSNEHILGMRFEVINVTWTEPNNDNLGLPGANGCNLESGQYFEVNDMFRNGYSAKTGLTVAYRESSVVPAEEGLWVSGRTDRGLAQTPVGTQPVRNNDFVNFRTDVNYEDPDGTDAQSSKWMYVKTTSTKTVWTAIASAVRLEQGGEEGQCKYRLTLSGYKP